ncbi:MAG: hypothetical protein A2219_01080 [Elusimicrobia bacterium RIFOXYA2_FULL_50_26]|nr:MAG: hypothetical protein A2219_01080 [Elusimicrobia bacterium RIFOXYA2_FULL_50_26]OGS23406.1 MAG: hypothetical protein A2314_00610 [Elusimicrobia bacterium RIFOXYB2_FULL_50_12]
MGDNTRVCRKPVDSKEVGLAFGLIFGKYFFNSHHLHYGYWTDDVPVSITNLPRAQEQYSDFIISHIPLGVKTILDVGCGAGALARKLTGKQYRVDAVSPCAILAAEARSILGDKCHIYETKFEQLDTDKKYDLIIFSESFQYIDIGRVFEQALRFLNKGGHILICDFFKTEAKGESSLGGGHRLTEFYETLKRYPLIVATDIDITKQTAPNIALVDDMLQNFGRPVWNLLFDYVGGRHPLLFKLINWKLKKKIEKINRKYFSGSRNSQNFQLFKSYRLVLCKSNPI